MLRKKFDPNLIILIFSFSLILFLLSLFMSRLILIAFPVYLLLIVLLAVYIHRKRTEE